MAEILIQRKRRRSVWPWLLGLLLLALIPLPFINREGVPRTTVATRTDTTAPASATSPDTTVGAPTAVAVGAGVPGGAGAGGAPGTASAPAGVGGEVAAGTASSAATATGERTTATAAGSIAPAESPRPASSGAAPSASPGARARPASESVAGSFERFIANPPSRSSERAYLEFTAEALRRLADELRVLGASERGVSVIRVHADSLQMPNARNSARPDYARAAFLGVVREVDLLRQKRGVRLNVAPLRSTAWGINPRRALGSQRATVERFFTRARDAVNTLSRSA